MSVGESVAWLAGAMVVVAILFVYILPPLVVHAELLIERMQ
jgi:hypothetical protein